MANNDHCAYGTMVPRSGWMVKHGNTYSRPSAANRPLKEQTEAKQNTNINLCDATMKPPSPVAPTLNNLSDWHNDNGETWINRKSLNHNKPGSQISFNCHPLFYLFVCQRGRPSPAMAVSIANLSSLGYLPGESAREPGLVFLLLEKTTGQMIFRQPSRVLNWWVESRLLLIFLIQLGLVPMLKSPKFNSEPPLPGQNEHFHEIGKLTHSLKGPKTHLRRFLTPQTHQSYLVGRRLEG